MRAADNGLHVLCEKPLVGDAPEARRVVDHCEDAGVTLMEAFMWRYHPRTERAIEIEHFVESVELGARPRTDGREAVRNMQVIDALANAAERGEAVEI